MSNENITEAMEEGEEIGSDHAEEVSKESDCMEIDEFPTCSYRQSELQRFALKKWQAQAMWSWDVAIDNCAICRNQIMDLCIECQAQSMNNNLCDECTVAWGTCNHAFHFHCISRWLRTRQVCPLDNTEWNYLRYGR